MIAQSFPPIIGTAPKVLILGSSPGVISLKKQQYFAHPRNAFWPIMGELFGLDISLEFLFGDTILIYAKLNAMARVVLPAYPHHITQRGNRRQDVFFKEEDYLYYFALLKKWCAKERIEIWSYCLMSNNVRLIVTPSNTSNLTKVIGETHRRYSLK